jgi:aryl-alcohol dehydrogenase-like predicted oxidoreductase
MQNAEIGSTGMSLSRMGLGTWAIGGTGYAYSWGGQREIDSVRTIRAAVDLGITWIDTAPVYGLGHSEEVIRSALRELQKSPERPAVSTKCGLVWRDTDRRVRHELSGPSIRGECEASLQRLGIDCIDLYFIHWPKPEDRLEEAWEELARLREQGKIRLCGVSNVSVSQIERVQALHPVDVVQVPYSIFDRGIENELLPYCSRHSVSVVTYSPLHNGVLTHAMSRERVSRLPRSDWRRKGAYFTEPLLSRVLTVVDGLRDLANLHGYTVPQVAAAWVLRRDDVQAAILGARRPEQIRETVSGAEIELSGTLLDQIDSLLYSARL